MSDLISRSALLKKFNDTGIQITFDLPVEEILGEDVNIDDFTMLVQDAIQVYKKMVIDTIKNQPTEFDTEKVVEQLEEKKIKELVFYGMLLMKPLILSRKAGWNERINRKIHKRHEYS